MENQTVAAPVTGTLAGAVAAPVAGLDPAEWLTIPDAAKAAGCLERTVRRWVSSGTVASRLDVDGRRRVQRSTLPASGTNTGSATGPWRFAVPGSVPATGRDTVMDTDRDTGNDTGSLDSSPLSSPR